MVFHGFSKPTSINPMPYTMNDWCKKKKKHKYDYMFFSLLDSEMIEDFYKFKKRFNLMLEPPPQLFTNVLQ
jgi:hypothetical protein